MHKKIAYILHVFSKINSFLLAFAVLFMLIHPVYFKMILLTGDRLIIFKLFYVDEIISSITVLLIIIKYINISSPYKKYLKNS
jgi:hypothetical protein